MVWDKHTFQGHVSQRKVFMSFAFNSSHHWSHHCHHCFVFSAIVDLLLLLLLLLDPELTNYFVHYSWTHYLYVIGANMLVATIITIIIGSIVDP